MDYTTDASRGAVVQRPADSKLQCCHSLEDHLLALCSSRKGWLLALGVCLKVWATFFKGCLLALGVIPLVPSPPSLVLQTSQTKKYWLLSMNQAEHMTNQQNTALPNLATQNTTKPEPLNSILLTIAVSPFREMLPYRLLERPSLRTLRGGAIYPGTGAGYVLSCWLSSRL